MGAAWYAEDNIEEPINTFGFQSLQGIGLVESRYANQTLNTNLAMSRNFSFGDFSNVAANQILVTPPVNNAMLSSTTYNTTLTPPVLVNSAMNTSLMRNSIVRAPLPVPEQSLYDATVGPVVDAVTDIFAPEPVVANTSLLQPGSIVQPTNIVQTGSLVQTGNVIQTGNIAQPSLITPARTYTPMQLPSQLPLYASNVGGGIDAPPTSVATPTNLPILSQFIQRRITQLGNFRLQGYESGTYLSQAYLFANLGIIYVGEWLRGKPHGRGMMIFPSGSIYDGYFSRGKTVGIGRFFQANGDYYEGEFSGLAAHGRGVCVVGNLIYEGEFLQNLPHGTGLESTLDGSVKFLGQYNHGQKVFGKMSWAGFVYKGPFVNGLFNGLGLVRTPQGIFQGNFVDGNMISGTPIDNMIPVGNGYGGGVSRVSNVGFATSPYASNIGVNPYASTVGVGMASSLNQLYRGSVVATPGFTYGGPSTLQTFAGPNYLNNYRLSAF